MKAVEVRNIKIPPKKENSVKTFRAGARCFSGVFLLRRKSRWIKNIYQVWSFFI